MRLQCEGVSRDHPGVSGCVCFCVVYRINLRSLPAFTLSADTCPFRRPHQPHWFETLRFFGRKPSLFTGTGTGAAAGARCGAALSEAASGTAG